MIDPVSTQFIPLNTLRAGPLREGDLSGAIEAPSSSPSGASGDTFSNMVGGLVKAVDAKTKVADTEVRHLMLGESDNIHRSMIAMQEAGLSFSLLVEVRNKLVEAYQELLRMPV